MNTARIASRDKAANVTTLQMRCDVDGIPSDLGESEVLGIWLSGSARYRKEPKSNVSLKTTGIENLEGLAVVVIDKLRVLGILTPTNINTDPLWWAWDLNSIKLDLYQKAEQPDQVDITYRNQKINLMNVYQLNTEHKQYFDNQEKTLLDALQQRWRRRAN